MKAILAAGALAALTVLAPLTASAATVSPVPAENRATRVHGPITSSFFMSDGVSTDTSYADGTFATSYVMDGGGYDTVFSDGSFAIAYPMGDGGFDTVYSDGGTLITGPAESGA
jgi:hypothetical protein